MGLCVLTFTIAIDPTAYLPTPGGFRNSGVAIPASLVLVGATLPGARAGALDMLEVGALVGLGDLSYGIYLWHMLAIYALRDLGMTGRKERVAFYVTTLVLSVGLAAVTRRFVEVPFLARKR